MKNPRLRLGTGRANRSKSQDMTPMLRKLDGLSVKVDDVIYMPSLDAPDERPHPFVYFISIKNESDEKVTIRGRKWIVREDDGEVTVVEGDGVVGQSPVIGPGENFSYNSYHVTRGDGTAEGAFFGETEDGEWVFTRIPEFRLTVPGWA
ncbi:ApaG domain [Luteolibacter sp. Y139]|uniref:ApaG domain n=2 Tax=Luteolibacter soli TaxID=3135280 RepID=A0ABU9B1Z2_9BACT